MPMPEPDDVNEPIVMELDEVLNMMRTLSNVEPNWGTMCPTADQVIYLLRGYFNDDRTLLIDMANEIAETH
jgi:hypothetical protein